MRSYARQKIIFGLLLVVFMAMQSSSEAQSKAELQESMKQRYPELQELRDEGKIGETYRGYVEAVTKKAKNDKEIQQLIKTENAERKALYEIIAQDVGTNAEAVGRINANRILQEADPDMYYKTDQGVWKQKKDVKIAE
ncbi:MAG: DUF1318 domain-containing protein [Chitinivibrionales bacterium]|nr:DUF1318 domain-containing protein [Chitinivibrionales bacterium]